MRKPTFATIQLEKIVGGGQALGTLDDGRKAFVWGGLPGETVTIRITKKKSHFVEGVVTEVLTASPERITPRNPESYLSTSPWQIMPLASEQHYKAALIEEAFELHDIVLPEPIDVFCDDVPYGYRNKVELSWYSDSAPDGTETLDLAFFRRGSKGKIIVDGTSLARPEINQLARQVRDLLRTKQVTARQLKTLLIRCDQAGNCVWQLYTKDCLGDVMSPDEATALSAQGGEIIYSDPRSPASRITERLACFGDPVLQDTILGVPFRYATEGFFQVNLPVYEQALRDMQRFVQVQDGTPRPTLDLYAGVGTIGLTIGSDNVTLVEINADAVREMQRNIHQLGRRGQAKAVLAPSEQALEYITRDALIILDPPRAGLHANVITKLLAAQPQRILYLSCNPVTQARDVALLATHYGIAYHRGYNFFPRTPHSEHLVVLDRLA
ncbi:class I SAM-dependent RNA methyltransferase [Candidatus Saccharibacteria bacterium]|nr:class I SAM-dependent RNA methyltransferase [Candidatus Saccharibacteria bacterium]